MKYHLFTTEFERDLQAFGCGFKGMGCWRVHRTTFGNGNKAFLNRSGVEIETTNRAIPAHV